MKKFSLAIILSFLLLPGLILAQNVTTAAFTGAVVDTDGKGLPGVTIKAVHLDRHGLRYAHPHGRPV